MCIPPHFFDRLVLLYLPPFRAMSHMKFSCVADAPDPEQVKVAEIGVVLVQVEMSKLSRIMVC
jgi:nitrate reductase beta subunit